MPLEINTSIMLIAVSRYSVEEVLISHHRQTLWRDENVAGKGQETRGLKPSQAVVGSRYVATVW